jgi:ABC-type bacteriocin/lantibiotic exporter with double-glycine peptidase domain
MIKYYKNLHQKDYKYFIIVLFSSASIALIEVITIGLIGIIAKSFDKESQASAGIKKITNYFNFDYLNSFYILPTLFLIFILIKSFLVYRSNKAILNFVENENYLLKIYFSNKLRNISYEHVRKINIDIAINAVVTNSNRYSNNYLLGIINLTNNFTLLVLLSALMFFVNYKIAILIFCFMAISGIIFDRIFKNKLKIDGLDSVEANNMLVSRARDLVEHPIEIRVYNYLEAISNIFKESAEKYRRSTVSWLLINLSVKNYLEVSILILLLLIVLYSIGSGMSVNQLMVVLTILGLSAFKALPAIGGILGSLTQIRFSLPALDELIKFKMDINKDGQFAQNTFILSCVHSIALKNIGHYFSHNYYLFKEINIQIKLGDRIAIIGKSGSGKSTLLEIIAGMREPIHGHVEINNTLPAFLNLAWYSKIGYITTNPIIKKGTLNDNIGEDWPKVKDLDIYKKLNVELSNDGLEPILEEQGKNISLGQKQRISFLRAMSSGKKVLIMDEPTSALDSENENEAIQMINNLDNNYIVIISTHSFKFRDICNKVIEI